MILFGFPTPGLNFVNGTVGNIWFGVESYMVLVTEEGRMHVYLYYYLYPALYTSYRDQCRPNPKKHAHCTIEENIDRGKYINVDVEWVFWSEKRIRLIMRMTNVLFAWDKKIRQEEKTVKNEKIKKFNF